MKIPILIIILICSLQFIAFGTVRTVCNMPYSPGQYTTFNAALTASAANDTIYIHGSSINYGAITINKPVVVIGTGHNPNKQVPLTSQFTNITISMAGVQLNGLILDNLSSGSFMNSNCIIKRCRFTGATPSYDMSLWGAIGWLIEGNVFMGVTHNNIYLNNADASNCTIRNNVFNTNFTAISSNSSLTTPFTFSITNNIFLGNTMGTFFGIYQAMINNNIFYRSSPQGTNTGCTMYNNISFSCSNNSFSATGANNLVGVNPQFVSFPLAGAIFDYTHDYRLAASSPGLVNGTDGTDRGIYGGFGYKFNMTGEPAIPEILFFAITSPTVISPGGTLTISVKSKRIR